MQPSVKKNAGKVNNSSRTRTSAHETGKTTKEPVQVQVIHQYIIPEKPTGLIGEKVVYNEKYLKRVKYEVDYPLPECGYFTITKAVLKDDGGVMVALHPHHHAFFEGGTHIHLGNMKKYDPMAIPIRPQAETQSRTVNINENNLKK